MGKRGEVSALEASTDRSGSADESAGDRRVPFLLQVAAVWQSRDELPMSDEGQLRFWQRAPMTGKLVYTSEGQDVGFSDLEIS